MGPGIAPMKLGGKGSQRADKGGQRRYNPPLF
jgi:hypothetical protein